MKTLLTFVLACAAVLCVTQVEARHCRSSFSLSFGGFAPICAPVCPRPVYVEPVYYAPAPYYYAPAPAYYAYPTPAPVYVYPRSQPVIGTSTTFSWYNCR